MPYSAAGFGYWYTFLLSPKYIATSKVMRCPAVLARKPNLAAAACAGYGYPYRQLGISWNALQNQRRCAAPSLQYVMLEKKTHSVECSVMSYRSTSYPTLQVEPVHGLKGLTILYADWHAAKFICADPLNPYGPWVSPPPAGCLGCCNIVDPTSSSDPTTITGWWKFK